MHMPGPAATAKLTALGASKWTNNFALTIFGKILGNKRLLPWNYFHTPVFNSVFKVKISLAFNVQ